MNFTTNESCSQVFSDNRDLAIEASLSANQSILALNLDTFSPQKTDDGTIEIVKISKYLPKPSSIVSLGIALPTVLVPNIARSQSKQNSDEDNLPSDSTAADINRQLHKALPANLANPKNIDNLNNTTNPTPSPSANSTTIGTAQYTFVISTPALIGVAVVIGGLALFPVLSLLLSSTKVGDLRKSDFFLKFIQRFQKAQVLESDKFLHRRTVEKLAQITNQAENLNADKFGNTEFLTFFRIKSHIALSIDAYANLDETIELLRVAIDAQNSFARIDSTESRYCSGGQQKLYKFVNSLLTQGLDSATFKELINQKLEEVLPLLKTEEGKVAVESYVVEMGKVSEHPLGLKLVLLFKKYQLDDFSTLRSVSNTINLLESEDLLNLDALMVLVMVKYNIFEKLGPIIGIEEQYNRPETYSKMLQYIGLKSRYETAYQKFQEFLLLLKQWEIQYKTILNVRNKYTEKNYQIPKEFSAEVPGFALYQKYKDSFHLITSVIPPTIATKQAETSEPELPILVKKVEAPAPELPILVTPAETPEPELPILVTPAETPEPELPILVTPAEAPAPELPILVTPAEAPAPELPVLVK
jgi:type II secretory pathway pseudopilin PulG